MDIGRPAGWMWKQWEWCITAHSKHRVIASRMDLNPPPTFIPKSRDFVSLHKLYTEEQLNQARVEVAERCLAICRDVVSVGRTHAADDIKTAIKQLADQMRGGE